MTVSNCIFIYNLFVDYLLVNMFVQKTTIVISIITSILSIIPVTLHALGIYLLHQPNPVQTNQKLYLINLSVIEILLVLIKNVSLHIKIFADDPTIYECLSLIHDGICFTWMNVLIGLTIDRFFEVWLNIKYGLYITENKTKLIILVSYFVGASISLALIVGKYSCDIVTKKISQYYLYPIYGTLTVIVFVLVYAYIYRRLRVARIRAATVNLVHIKENKRNHFIPMWIIVSFILFIYIPFVMYTIVFFTMKITRRDSHIYQVLNIIFLMNFTADALIYILLHQAIREKFLSIIRWKMVGSRNQRAVAPSDVT